MTQDPVLLIRGVRKQYQALRPLRLNELIIGRGERVAVSGFDAGASEVLVNLVTGASLPDEGEVRILGRSTASIADGDDWLASLDRYGIVTPRAVLLDAATLRQNLAMPLTLSIDPLSDEMALRAAALGAETGIAADWLDKPIAGLPPAIAVRAHLARAVALEPALLILEHPTAALDPADRRPFGEIVSRVVSARGLAAIIISEDTDFTASAAERRYTLHPASGDLKPRRRFLRF
jgi:phospholipid/cholesterol/gamma-HCH transport system ATP-binding protein